MILYLVKDSIPIILLDILVQDIDTQEDWTRAEFMYEVIQKNLNEYFSKS